MSTHAIRRPREVVHVAGQKMLLLEFRGEWSLETGWEGTVRALCPVIMTRLGEKMELLIEREGARDITVHATLVKVTVNKEWVCPEHVFRWSDDSPTWPALLAAR